MSKVNEKRLAELIINNPELKVLCICDEECSELGGLGEISHCAIDAFVIGVNINGDKRYYFKSEAGEPRHSTDVSSDMADIIFYRSGVIPWLLRWMLVIAY